MKKRTFRGINDEIERLCSEGIDVPDEEFDEDGIEFVDETAYECELEQALNALGIEQKTKINDIGEYCLYLKSEDERLGKEAQRMLAWQKRARNRGIWLKWYCLQEMIRAGISHVKGKFLTVAVRTSPVSAEYEKDEDGEPDVHEIDPRFVRTVVEHKVDSRGAIKRFKELEKMRKEGQDIYEEIPGFTFNESNKHLRIG